MSTSQWSSTNSLTTKASYIPNTEEVILSAPDLNASYQFGTDVAISGDGNRCIVGAPYANGSATTSGKVYIFTRSGTTWSLENGFVPGTPENSGRAGTAVSIDETGTRVAIASMYYPGGGSIGRVYIYLRTGTSWGLEATLTGIGTGDYFGSDICINGLGDRLVIGAYGRDANGSDSGSSYIYKRTGTTWSQELVWSPSDNVSLDYFGCSVSIDYSGTRAIIGSYLSDPGGVAAAGSAYVIVRSGSTWTQEAKLTASDKAVGARFGISCSINNDGTRCVIGTYQATVDSFSACGKAYIFVRSGSTWNQQAKLVANDAYFNSYFGNSVDISGDGSICVVTSYNKNNSTGQAYIFIRSGTNWSQSQGLIAGDGSTNDNFGYSCSISTNGSRIIIGSIYGDKPSVANCGSVYIFDKFGPIWTQQAEVNPSNGINGGSFGWSISISGDGNLIVAGTLNSKAYIFT